MKFQTQLTWPAPLARVLAMITDRRYVERKQEASTAERWEIASCSDDGRHFAVSVRSFNRPGENLPAVARRFINQDQLVEVLQHDRWDRDTASGTTVVENLSYPSVTVTASMQLTEADGLTTNTITWDVNCSIPLVGGKLAELVAGEIRAKVGHNEALGRRILAELA